MEKRRKMLIFSELIYKPTGEKITEAFRYFACDIDPVEAAATAGDLEALTRLPYALDEDGDRDTSSVLVDLAYTPSGSFVAVQPVQYQDYGPVPVAPTVILEGASAKALIASAKALGD
ncbi:hypothetical protein [Enhygromyxa salina]|uniref:hypothetical protein n=1 Tax=Enhygromyxa salina TaxID=215803 RepID=UPI002158E076|nr:hypothetical protein [Enhygromyxa salina]